MIGLLMSSAFFDKALQAFSYMLLHSVWQGLLLAVVTGGILLLVRKAAPAVRYLIMCALYGVFLLTCVGSFVYGWHSAGMGEVALTAAPSAGKVPVNQGFQYWVTSLAAFCARYNHFILIIWLAIFGMRCWQMIRAVRYMATLRVNHIQAANEVWNERLALLSKQLGIDHTIRLLESGLTRVPVVMGHLKPVIYVPLGMLSGLPAGQVEAILLHELAHVKRYDYLVNLVQTVVDAVFFFNPGLLWVSYLIKEEREHCCDDVVLVQTGNKKQFVEALINFKEQTMHPRSLSLAFPGRKSQLIQRVSRIVYGHNSSFSTIEKGFLAFSFLICLFVLISLGGSQWGTSLVSGHQTPRQDKVLLIAQRTQEQSMQQVLVRAAAEMPKQSTLPARVKNDQFKVINTTAKQVPPTDNSRVKITENQFADELHAREMSMLLAFKDAAEDQQQDAAAQQLERDRYADLQLVNAREIAAQDMARHRKLAEQQRERATIERKKAEEARARAQIDRQRADEMRQQADKERERAAILRLEADKQRAHADEMRKQAEEMRVIADKERQKAEVARKIAEEQRVKAASDRLRAEQQRQVSQRYTIQSDTKATSDQSIPSTSD